MNTATTIELKLGGMTCASCAARIEKRLNRLDGVEARVNYATETATVTADPTIGTDDLIGAVASIGYSAALVTPDAVTDADAPKVDEHDVRQDTLRQRLLASAVLTLPVLVLAMIPRLQFDSWQWLSLTLAAPVVVWGGWPFHRTAWANLKHGAATMDTLISLGTLAAFGWSLWALFLGDAGDPAMRMKFDLTPSVGSGTNELYLEVASVVTVFILAGRYFEARAKRQAGTALRALLELGAKDVAVVRGRPAARRRPWRPGPATPAGRHRTASWPGPRSTGRPG